MIEVEKKFQPTEEQLEALLKDSVFVKEVINRDILYDYPDYKLIKAHIRLRNRNGSFELKFPTENSEENGGGDRELEEEEEIKKYFNTDLSLSSFVSENMKPVVDITTYRKKYKKDEFSIDIDHVDSVLDFCEIEILVEKEDQIKEASDKILNLAREYDFEIKKLPSKRELYLKHFAPEIYNQIYT